MGSRRAIDNDEYSPETDDFFRPRQKKIGSRARLCPRDFFCLKNEKNRGWSGYIIIYSPTTPHIHNKYTTFFLSPK